MANFTPPFGTSGDTRFPTSDERANGFFCGPADRELFNGLLQRLEAEMGNVMNAAGLTQTDADMTQLLQAINFLIEAATGGGATENYLLMTQARARLPIFPEIQTTDGTMTLTAPATGTVRVPGGVTFLHRGIFPVTTAQTDFTTEANNTYHVRWNAADGLVFKRLADATYNPSSLSEAHSSFDSKYDDMIIARVITNSANVATITNLINKNDIRIAGEEISAFGSLSAGQHQDGVRPSQTSQYTAVNINFARTPMVYLTAINDLMTRDNPQLSGEVNVGARPLNRYQVAVWGQGDIDIWTGWAARA